MIETTTNAQVKVLTPVKAMRAKCLDCTCNQPNEVKLCTIPTCPLYPYRLGKRPTPEGQPPRSKRVLSESHKAALAVARQKRAEMKKSIS